MRLRYPGSGRRADGPHMLQASASPCKTIVVAPQTGPRPFGTWYEDTVVDQEMQRLILQGRQAGSLMHKRLDTWQALSLLWFVG